MKSLFTDLGPGGALSVLAAVVLLPVGGLMAADAIGMFEAEGPERWGAHLEGPPPAWTNELKFTAQTSDGHPVMLEVAIDAPDRATLRELSADTAQLTLLLKLQVGRMLSRELKSPDGIDELRYRMLEAVRDRVGDDQDALVRQVAIGNLIVKTP
jgi:hypothetical protein